MRIWLRLWRLSTFLLVAMWLTFTIMHLTIQWEGSGFVKEIYRSKHTTIYCEDASEDPKSHRYTAWLPEKDNQLKCRWQQMRNQLGEWQLQVQSYCSDNVFTVSAASFLMLRNVIVDPSRASGRLGGEEIREVLNQPEQEEYWTLKSGAFKTVCSDTTSGSYLTDLLEPLSQTGGLHSTFIQYLTATVTLDPYEFERMSVISRLLNESVLAVTRHEYANLYQTVIHLYNAFTNAIFFGIDPAEATVLLIDGHPRGGLDPIWSILFRRVIRIGELNRPHVLRDMIWVTEGHKSPMQEYVSNLPLIQEFRQFFLAQYGIPISQQVALQSKSCSGSQVVLIWRRDYLAHPRNPKGYVARAIANEPDVFKEVSAAFPQLELNVTGVVMENLTFSEQLHLIAGTRVLIGMHGAGLTHATFLPKGSGLIELFPDSRTQENFHFRNIAAWRGLAYEQWVSGANNTDLPIAVPRGVLTRLMHSVLRKMACL